ncbi:MAG: hypothetical protein ACT4NP_17940 [Pseudonocardiales bacterium]
MEEVRRADRLMHNRWQEELLFSALVAVSARRKEITTMAFLHSL